MPTNTMPAHKYRPFPRIDLPDRRWPDATICKAPQWCSVDLRDGNQALVEPMGLERKLRDRKSQQIERHGKLDRGWISFQRRHQTRRRRYQDVQRQRPDRRHRHQQCEECPGFDTRACSVARWFGRIAVHTKSRSQSSGCVIARSQVSVC